MFHTIWLAADLNRADDFAQDVVVVVVRGGVVQDKWPHDKKKG